MQQVVNESSTRRNFHSYFKWSCFLLGQILIFYITFTLWNATPAATPPQESNSDVAGFSLSNFSSSSPDQISSQLFKFTQLLENWNEKYSMTSDKDDSNQSDITSIKKLLELLIEYKYADSDSDSNMEKMNSLDKLRALTFPIRIHVYPLSQNGTLILQNMLQMCRNHLFDTNTLTFFPHAYIDCYLMDFIGRNSTLNPYIEIVDNIDEANLAYIPIPLVMDYYNSIKHGEGEKDFLKLTNQIKISLYSEFIHSGINVEEMERNFDKVPHFVTYSYVSYRVSFEKIPKSVKIVTLENVAITGPPQHAWYDNGCHDRCLTIPYVTIFDWPSYFGNNHTLDHQSWPNRPYLLSFIGSLNRTEILFIHRYHLVTKLSAHSTKQFHTFKESITTSSNTEIYAKSKFCLQLHGDTPTRNAFYESLLMGCIPVITEKTFLSYRSLFGYLLPVEEFTIVIDNKYTEEGDDNVRDIIEHLEYLDTSGKYLKMLKIFKSLEFFMRYTMIGGQPVNFIPLLSILSAQIPLSIPPRYKKQGEIDLFLGRPITSVYKWMHFTIQPQVEIVMEECNLYGGKIYLPKQFLQVEWRELVEINHLPTLIEFNLIQRFKNEDILTDDIENANIIFYPFNLNRIFNFTNILPENSLGMKKVFLISNDDTPNKGIDFQMERITFLDNIRTIQSIFNKTILIYTLEDTSYFTEGERVGEFKHVRTLPFHSFLSNNDNCTTINSNINTINVKRKDMNIENRNHLICQVKSNDIHESNDDQSFNMEFLLETHFGNQYPQLFKTIHLWDELMNCDYVLLPNKSMNSSKLIYHAILHGTIPLAFNLPNLDKNDMLSHMKNLAIQIPKPIQDMHHESVELFSNWLIRFVQNISFEETQKKRKSLQRLTRYFTLSPCKSSTHDLYHLILSSLNTLN